MIRRLRSDRARVYLSVRSAHLERARQLPAAAILYSGRRYDFDDGLTAGLELHQVTPLSVAVLLARSRVRVLEINEPLMLASLRMTAPAVTAVRIRGLLTGRRTTVVSYAIVNLDPFGVPVGGGPRERLRRTLDRLLARFVWAQLDRVCYGTAAARDVYARSLPRSSSASGFVPALPVAAPAPGGVGRDPLQVLFLGAFLARKGIDRVLAAWPLVVHEVPGAHLLVLGKGARQDDVLAAAAQGARIEVRVDPPRDVIQQELARSQVLTLPSQPDGAWREQVGLPIVEALAAGCSVVTTTQTGLAGWLADHGHSVLPPQADTAELAAAIVAQLRAARPAEEVLADLPERDGRLAADAWLFGRSAADALHGGLDGVPGVVTGTAPNPPHALDVPDA